MEFNGRGFYNTLQFSSSPQKEKWQSEDYRVLSTSILFKRLKNLGLDLNEPRLQAYIEEVDSPEELAELLASEQSVKELEQSYLLLFELWRRLAPTKENLSIFCDKLDHLCFEYDHEQEVSDKLIDALFELQKILEGLNIGGLSYHKAYETVSSYLAQDLETFVYDFISDLIETGEHTVAFELLFGLDKFLKNPLPFELLKSALNLLEDPERGEAVFLNVIDKLFDHKEHGLLLDALYFSAKAGHFAIASSMAEKLMTFTHGEEKKELASLLATLKETFHF